MIASAKALYERRVQSTRGGLFFQLHPYPTKINPEAIVPFIRAHTNPGELIYDCFAGSGSVAAAAATFVADQTQATLGAEAVDGPRFAICNDLGYLPSWVAKTLFNGAEGESFREHAYRALDGITKKWSWLYGGEGLRYAIWTDFVLCASCKKEIAFFDSFVDKITGGFRSTTNCPECNSELKATASRVLEDVADPVLGTQHRAIKRRIAAVLESGSKNPWGRPPTKDDVNRVKKASKSLADQTSLVPVVSLAGRWGEMYRAGYHSGISHVHHFYTPRNLLAISLLFDAAKRLPAPFDDLFRLAISSYNFAHSTIMTRFVFKKNQARHVVTSAQPGALYVGHCPVEKNVFAGVQEKVNLISEYLNEVQPASPYIKVRRGPAQDSGLPADSIDYIFTDPPFGGNIQYSEIAVLSEAWLGNFTDATDEAIVSRSQGKDVAQYEALLAASFAECFRVLKPGRFMTVVFHNTSKRVWQALQAALTSAGFVVLGASVLDKTQGSFKQVTTLGAVSKDPVILAVKPESEKARRNLETRVGGHERTQTLDYSEYVAERLRRREKVDMDAREFRALRGR